MAEVPEINRQAAELFEETATLLERLDDNPNRIEAYRRAAAYLRGLTEPITAIHEEAGVEGLQELPTIGQSLAGALRDIILHDSFRTLERLRARSEPTRVLATVPGMGDKLAKRVHDTLGVETLEELEEAAHSGALADVEGFGEKRVRAVKETLSARLRRRRGPRRANGVPSVGELLDIDREYRRRADAGDLPKIAPKRFNPQGKAWLPILHTERHDRRYTVLFSNTARAHELGKTDDWVVIYLDNQGGGQWTVVTESSGPLTGRRVVRGREAESKAYYYDNTS